MNECPPFFRYFGDKAAGTKLNYCQSDMFDDSRKEERVLSAVRVITPSYADRAKTFSPVEGNRGRIILPDLQMKKTDGFAGAKIDGGIDQQCADPTAPSRYCTVPLRRQRIEVPDTR